MSIIIVPTRRKNNTRGDIQHLTLIRGQADVEVSVVAHLESQHFQPFGRPERVDAAGVEYGQSFGVAEVEEDRRFDGLEVEA